MAETVPAAPPASAPEPPSAEAQADVAAPLLGCLYCHREGTTTLSEGRRLFRLGPPVQVLTCSACGSVAHFEPGPDSSDWRIRYRRTNQDDAYYYMLVYLGSGRWLNAADALRISRRGYVQRQRMAQAAKGDLSWLSPTVLDPPPPLMSPDETVYLTCNPATFQQATRGGVLLARDEENVLDSGILYVTDHKIHLLGRRRDWSHRLEDIREVEHNTRYWRVHVGSTQQHYQGINHADQIDAQLFTTVLDVLIAQRG